LSSWGNLEVLRSLSLGGERWLLESPRMCDLQEKGGLPSLRRQIKGRLPALSSVSSDLKNLAALQDGGIWPCRPSPIWPSPVSHRLIPCSVVTFQPNSQSLGWGMGLLMSGALLGLAPC